MGKELFFGNKTKKILLTKNSRDHCHKYNLSIDRKINERKYQLFFHNTFNNFLIK